MSVELVALQPGPADKLAIVARACRICHATPERDDDAALVERVVRLGHTSVLEHARATCLRVLDHADLWPVRYGVSVTPGDGYQLVTVNARASEEMYRNFNLWPDAPRYHVSHLSHTDALAHAAVTFEISGISRACSHQIVRHRAASYSQESQRHVTPGADVVIPPAIAIDADAREIYLAAVNAAQVAYAALRARGYLREDARYILPQSTETRMLATFPLWSLRNFLRQRLALDAQWEIRRVAQEMRALVAETELAWAVETLTEE